MGKTYRPRTLLETAEVFGNMISSALSLRLHSPVIQIRLRRARRVSVVVFPLRQTSGSRQRPKGTVPVNGCLSISPVKKQKMALCRYVILFAAAAFALWPRVGVSADFETRPNIILVFIDDMGWADFSCFGNKDAVTPSIDGMAAQGIAFEQFYVNSPICSPSRVAISTGQYPQRWNITSYLAHRGVNEKRGVANWLDPRAPMLARSLQKAGYATGHFGKWHMGGQRDVTDAPAIGEYGFDESLTNFEGLGPKLLPLTQRPDGRVGRIWADAERLGKPVTWMQRSEITTGFIDAAIAFIDKAHQSDKPFYINLWPDDVLAPNAQMGGWRQTPALPERFGIHGRSVRQLV